jgi:nucleoside-diphosphate-sugar epimerase
MKRALVCGAGGFIGSHMVRRLKSEEYRVIGMDLKYPEFSKTEADLFFLTDLRNQSSLNLEDGDYDEVYQFAADMGGCQFIFGGNHDADIMHNSAQINLNICEAFKNTKTKIFYSSSACIYPQQIQDNPNALPLKESDAYPANPDSEYGWEKLFSERLYQAYFRNYDLDVRIGRFHNIYGPEGTYSGGREKAPASISRKVIENDFRIWGNGDQTRSFLYIDDCIDAIRLLMQSDHKQPINIGSEEMVSIKQLWEMIINISGKTNQLEYIDRPGNFLGVKGRNSDNTLIRSVLGWDLKYSLQQGLEKTYKWITSQYEA